MLDQIHAYHPSGKLHASSPDYPDFEACMQRQGFRTERVPAAECQGDWLRTRPLAPVSQPAASLPALGDWVNTPLLGLLQITHFVTPAGEPSPLPVGVGPQGAGIVRAGQWQAAASASAPARPASTTAQSQRPSGHRQPSLFESTED